ncbi:MAG: APC family permease [Candidatus Jidaibacter sp.]|jgi:amino acid efflux transporter|nr:APC family permease [Candidatus Jidaibacter sp.]
MSNSKQAHLVRELDITALVVYYFSTIVGVGIFIVPLFAAKIAGPASLISWMLALLCAYPFAMIFAHISQRYQVSGSIQKFLEDAWGNKFGKSMALFLVVSALFGNALLGFAAAQYCNEFLNSEYNIYWIGLAFLIVPVLFNLLKVGLSSKIQTFSLISLVVLVEAVVVSSVPEFNSNNLEPFFPNGWGAIIPAVAICFYSITGWENVDALAEEVKDPVKTYRKAAKIAVGLIALFYMSIALTVVLVMDYEALGDVNTILTAILNVTLGATASKLGGAMAIVLLVLGANAWVFGTSRIIYALARDGILPKSLTKISSNKVPYYAVMAQLIPYFLIAASFVFADMHQDTVVEITSLNYLLLYTIIFFSGIKIFTTHRLKGLSAAAMLITAYLLLQGAYHVIGISVLLLLVCFSYVYFLPRRKIVSPSKV